MPAKKTKKKNTAKQQQEDETVIEVEENMDPSEGEANQERLTKEKFTNGDYGYSDNGTDGPKQEEEGEDKDKDGDNDDDNKDDSNNATSDGMPPECLAIQRSRICSPWNKQPHMYINTTALTHIYKSWFSRAIASGVVNPQVLAATPKEIRTLRDWERLLILATKQFEGSPFIASNTPVILPSDAGDLLNSTSSSAASSSSSKTTTTNSFPVPTQQPIDVSYFAPTIRSYYRCDNYGIPGKTANAPPIRYFKTHVCRTNIFHQSLGCIKLSKKLAGDAPKASGKQKKENTTKTKTTKKGSAAKSNESEDNSPPLTPPPESDTLEFPPICLSACEAFTVSTMNLFNDPSICPPNPTNVLPGGDKINPILAANATTVAERRQNLINGGALCKAHIPFPTSDIPCILGVGTDKTTCGYGSLNAAMQYCKDANNEPPCCAEVVGLVVPEPANDNPDTGADPDSETTIIGYAPSYPTPTSSKKHPPTTTPSSKNSTQTPSKVHVPSTTPTTTPIKTPKGTPSSRKPSATPTPPRSSSSQFSEETETGGGGYTAEPATSKAYYGATTPATATPVYGVGTDASSLPSATAETETDSNEAGSYSPTAPASKHGGSGGGNAKVAALIEEFVVDEAAGRSFDEDYSLGNKDISSPSSGSGSGDSSSSGNSKPNNNNKTTIIAIGSVVGILALVGIILSVVVYLRARSASLKKSNVSPMSGYNGSKPGSPGNNESFENRKVVLHDYDAILPDEITLNLGDTVEVIATYDDGWGRGRNLTTGQSGVFPMQCFVE